MSKEEPTEKDLHLVAISAILVLCAFAWFFYFSDVIILEYLYKRWVDWFGVKWYEDNPWRTTPALLFVMFVPAALLMAIAIWAARRFYYTNFASIHETNIKELGKARSALQQSLVSIDAIEREFKGKLESYERLQQQLEELQTVKHIDTQELQKKLNAIALASRHTVWFQRIVGFIVGIFSSLLAAYIWERINAI